MDKAVNHQNETAGQLAEDLRQATERLVRLLRHCAGWEEVAQQQLYNCVHDRPPENAYQPVRRQHGEEAEGRGKV